jgi:alkyl sulfatase BDS1-like metallo-beta-lactamase superfamily hydrolase
MCKMVIEIVPDKVYLAWGYALASPTMIVGDDGLIIIDPPDSMEATQIAYDDMREVAGTDLPVKAVVYSHSHPDHFPGIRVFADEKSVIIKNRGHLNGKL